MAEFQLDVTSSPRRTRKGAGGPGAAPAAQEGGGGKLARKAAPGNGAGKLRRRKAWHARSKARTAERKEVSRKRVAAAIAALRAHVTKQHAPETAPVAHIGRPEWMHPKAYHVACAGMAAKIKDEPRNWSEWLAAWWRDIREAQANATGKPCERMPSGHPFTKENVERYRKTARAREVARDNTLGLSTERPAPMKKPMGAHTGKTRVRELETPKKALMRVQEQVARLVKGYLGVTEALASLEHGTTVDVKPKVRARAEWTKTYWGGALKLTVPTRWYTRVHLRGLAILDGRLVIDAEPAEDGRWRVAYVADETTHDAQGKEGKRYFVRHGFVSRRGPGFLALADDAGANMAERAADMAQALDVL